MPCGPTYRGCSTPPTTKSARGGGGGIRFVDQYVVESLYLICSQCPALSCQVLTDTALLPLKLGGVE